MKKSFLGVAYLAAMHKKFPLRALKVFNRVDKPAMAVLWNFFGGRKKALIEFMNMCSDRPHMLQIYLLHRWGTGIDSKDVNKVNQLIEDRNPRTMRRIKKRLIRITKFVEANANSNTVPVLCLDLESTKSKKALQILQDMVDEVWPYDTCVNMLHGTKDIEGADYQEIHHDHDLKEGQIGTLDGQEIRFKHRDGNYGSDSISEEGAFDYMERNYGKAEAIMFWSKLHQGLTGNTASSKPPKQRDIEVPVKDIKWMRRAMKRIQK